MRRTTRLVLLLGVGLLLICSAGMAATLTVGAGRTYTTIQAAINAAAAGDIIEVDAGTYSGALSITKSLALKGPHATTTPGAAPRDGGEAVIAGGIDRLADDVTISGFTFSNWITGSTVRNLTVTFNRFMGTSAYYNEAGTMTDATFSNNYLSGGATGIFGANWTGGTINDNVFEDMTYCAANVQGTGLTISNNRVDGAAAYAFQVYSASGGVTISGNIITDTGWVTHEQDKGGIRLYGTDYTGSISITGNNITNSYRALCIKDGQNITGKTISITGNTFGADNDMFIWHGGTGTLDATNNTFGGAQLASQKEAKIFHKYDDASRGLVLYGQDEVPSVVWVDDSWAGSALGAIVDGHVFGYDAFPAIQQGVTAVAANGTVNVLAGTYPESVAIAKAVTLSGPQSGVLAKGRTGAEAVVQPASGNAFTVNANDVTIDGFKIMATASASAIDHTGSGVSGLKVLNNSASGGYGVHLYGCCRSFQIEGNDLRNIQPVYVNTGSGRCESGSTIKNNDIGPADIGININCVPGKALTGLTIENNRLAGAQIALFTVENVEIKSNTIAIAGGSGIFVGGSCDGLTIDGNIVSATADNSCIRITTFYSLNKGITITDNDLRDASYGVKVTAGAIASSNELTFSGTNTIDNTASADGIGLWLGGVASGNELNISDMEFGSGLAEFIHLDAWTPGVDATTATFSDAADDAAKEAKVWHDVDDATLGHVNWGQNGGAPATECVLAVSDVSGAVGQTVQLNAKLTAGGVALAGQSVAFSVDGTAVANGTTDAAGVAAVPYGPLTIGDKTITARFSGVSPYKATTGTGTLTVAAAAPTAITLTVDPTSVASGGTATCTVLGDNGVDYTDVCTYYAQYGAGGAWANNVYTSAKAGTWNVTAVYNTLADTKPLTVTPGAAASVTLTPATATINPDATQEYAVTATDAAGNTWTPAEGDITWAEDGAGSFTGYVYTPDEVGDAGSTVSITATVGGVTSNAATLNVNAATGAGTILAWDKDTRKFYLCSNASDPQTGTEITGSGDYGGIAVTVSGTGTNVTVTAGGASLRVMWYLRSGSLYKAYQYSNGTSAGSKTATYDGRRTLVDGAWKTGFWGLTHTIDAGTTSYGSAQQ